MNILEFFAIAIALAMDAFAVSISYGCSSENICRKNTIYIAASLGMFQAGMPVIGWYGGKIFPGELELYAHWIAFILLAFIGLKMIFEGIKDSSEPLHCENVLKIKRLLILSIATSIDALAVGVSFSIIKEQIFMPSIIIGITTFIICIYGMIMGSKMREHMGQKMEILGGIILLGIGIKILLL